MIHAPITVLPFHFVSAIALILMTGGMGYVIGATFARLWNAVHEH